MINTLPRTIGVESELSNFVSLCNHNFRHLSYRVTSDGSVVPSGQELVTVPMLGDVFLSAMIELGQTCEAIGAEINHTCGFHVHVGAVDLSYWHIRRLLNAYVRLEPEIYQYLILPHRRENPKVTHYCKMLTREHECERCGSKPPHPEPIHHTLARMDTAQTQADLKVQLARRLYSVSPLRAGELRDEKASRYHQSRYYGLNLHSFHHRGTIEFRMKEGTTDVMELIHWPLWCGWLVQAVTGRLGDAESKSPQMSSIRYVTEKYMPRWMMPWVESKLQEKK